MHAQGLAPHNVIASYPDMKHARRAIEALQFAGVDANQISLLGQTAEQAASWAEKDTTQADTPLVMQILLRAVPWALVGAITGVALGGILAAIGFEYGPVGASATVQIASWGLFGTIVGALVGAYSAITVSEAWELTFEPVDDGRVLVGVHSDDEKDVESAARILREKEALSVARFDEHGNPTA
jgi:outer membrane lipoprotein SlyB